MDDDNIEGKSHETLDKLAKLLLGTVAGFLASKAAENLYDNLVVARRDQ